MFLPMCSISLGKLNEMQSMIVEAHFFVRNLVKVWYGRTNLHNIMID